MSGAPVRWRARARDERGQASAELIGMMPWLVLAALGVWQLLLVGFAVVSAENAARAAGRVEGRGGDGPQAARLAVQPALREGLEASFDAGEVRVRVRVPILMPGLTADDVAVTRGAELPSTTSGARAGPWG